MSYIQIILLNMDFLLPVKYHMSYLLNNKMSLLFQQRHFASISQIL